MRNIRLTIAYDGTDYVGWQIQPNGPSVQAALQRAIEKLTGESVSLLAAGRTDSGVHALGQVVSFQTHSTIPVRGFRDGLATYLPDDIVVREAEDVPPEFHATHSARRKRYRYVIHNSRIADPLLRRYAWRVSVPLDSATMHEAGQALLGTHDFRCFESQGPNKATSVRTVMEATVVRCDGWPVWGEKGGRNHLTAPPEGFFAQKVPDSFSSEFICFDIVADGFLYNMVRAIAGTLVHVGRGRWTIEDVRRIIQSQERALAGETAPACGLYLVHVDYAR